MHIKVTRQKGSQLKCKIITNERSNAKVLTLERKSLEKEKS